MIANSFPSTKASLEPEWRISLNFVRATKTLIRGKSNGTPTPGRGIFAYSHANKVTGQTSLSEKVKKYINDHSEILEHENFPIAIGPIYGYVRESEGGYSAAKLAQFIWRIARPESAAEIQAKKIILSSLDNIEMEAGIDARQEMEALLPERTNSAQNGSSASSEQITPPFELV